MKQIFYSCTPNIQYTLILLYMLITEFVFVFNLNAIKM